MSTLKTKYVVRKLEESLLAERSNEQLLIENINTVMLQNFKNALQRGEQLDDVLSSIGWTKLDRLVKEFNTSIRNEFKKSTEFFGDKTLIRSKIKRWFQQYWTNGPLQKFDEFLEDLDNSIKQVIAHLDAVIPKHKSDQNQLIKEIPDVLERYSVIYKIILNAFSFRNKHSNLPMAIQECAEKLFAMSFIQIKVLGDVLSDIRNDVDQTTTKIDNIEQKVVDNKQSDKTTSTDQHTLEEPTSTPQAQPELNVHKIIDSFVDLPQDDFAKIMRVINARRKLEKTNPKK